MAKGLIHLIQYKILLEAQIKIKIFRETIGNELRSYIHVKDVAKITYKSLEKKYENNYFNIFVKKNILVKNLLNRIKKYVPGLKIKYAKKDTKMYNYKKNPFTYKLRAGKNLRLKKYISIDEGLKKLILLKKLKLQVLYLLKQILKE